MRGGALRSRRLVAVHALCCRLRRALPGSQGQGSHERQRHERGRPRRCRLPSPPAEDHLFGDKEKFVTAAYRAKLAERQAWLEERKRK